MLFTQAVLIRSCILHSTFADLKNLISKIKTLVISLFNPYKINFHNFPYHLYHHSPSLPIYPAFSSNTPCLYTTSYLQFHAFFWLIKSPISDFITLREMSFPREHRNLLFISVFPSCWEVMHNCLMMRNERRRRWFGRWGIPRIYMMNIFRPSTCR